jgi:hypothetical protein
MRLKIGALFACLAMAFVAPACAVQQQPTDESAQSDQTESAQSDLTGTTATKYFCNGREPGLPIPFGQEVAFEQCQANCLSGGGHPSEAACKRTCCLQFTGCNQCFEQ